MAEPLHLSEELSDRIAEIKSKAKNLAHDSASLSHLYTSTCDLFLEQTGEPLQWFHQCLDKSTIKILSRCIEEEKKKEVIRKSLASSQWQVNAERLLQDFGPGSKNKRALLKALSDGCKAIGERIDYNTAYSAMRKEWQYRTSGKLRGKGITHDPQWAPGDITRAVEAIRRDHAGLQRELSVEVTREVDHEKELRDDFSVEFGEGDGWDDGGSSTGEVEGDRDDFSDETRSADRSPAFASIHSPEHPAEEETRKAPPAIFAPTGFSILPDDNYLMNNLAGYTHRKRKNSDGKENRGERNITFPQNASSPRAAKRRLSLAPIKHDRIRPVDEGLAQDLVALSPRPAEYHSIASPERGRSARMPELSNAEPDVSFPLELPPIAAVNDKQPLLLDEEPFQIITAQSPMPVGECSITGSKSGGGARSPEVSVSRSESESSFALDSIEHDETTSEFARSRTSPQPREGHAVYHRALRSLNSSTWVNDLALECVLEAISDNLTLVLHPKWADPSTYGSQTSLTLSQGLTRVILPVNHDRHWSVGIIDLTTLRAKQFDSRFPAESAHCVAVRQKIEIFLRWLRDTNPGRWQRDQGIEVQYTASPIQTNNDDCGVHVLMSCARDLAGPGAQDQAELPVDLWRRFARAIVLHHCSGFGTEPAGKSDVPPLPSISPAEVSAQDRHTQTAVEKAYHGAAASHDILTTLLDRKQQSMSALETRISRLQDDLVPLRQAQDTLKDKLKSEGIAVLQHFTQQTTEVETRCRQLQQRLARSKGSQAALRAAVYLAEETRGAYGQAARSAVYSLVKYHQSEAQRHQSEAIRLLQTYADLTMP